jgi:hypothetical protein
LRTCARVCVCVCVCVCARVFVRRLAEERRRDCRRECRRMKMRQGEGSLHAPSMRLDRDLDTGLMCMKLQNPPRVHSLCSYWRQHASRKSVTGESSAMMGRSPNQRLFRSLTAFSASSSSLNMTYLCVNVSACRVCVNVSACKRECVACKYDASACEHECVVCAWM